MVGREVVDILGKPAVKRWKVVEDGDPLVGALDERDESVSDASTDVLDGIVSCSSSSVVRWDEWSS